MADNYGLVQHMKGLYNIAIGAKESLTNAIRTIETEHSYIHEGIFFESYNKFTLAAAATRLVTLKTPVGVYLHYRPTNLVTSADKVTIEFFEGATVTAATGTGGTRTGSSAGVSNSEWVLKPNTVYMIRVTNGSSGSNDIQVNFQWYEENVG